MPAGSCFCGNIRIEYSGQPVASALCHCYDCRKLTGTLYSYSFIVKSTELTITGNPKEVPKTADSGNHIKNYFCPDCGTPLYGVKLDSSGVPEETTVLRAGVFDDLEFLNQNKPQLEIFVGGRANWVHTIEGAGQFPAMP